MNSPLKGRKVRLRGLGGGACTASPAAARPQPGPTGRRRHHSVGLAALLALGASACDPLHSMQLRQSLNPAPSMECVGRALAGSPRVLVIRETTGPAGPEAFLVRFRSHGASFNRFAGGLRREVAGDSAGALAFDYTWLGHQRPEREEEPVMKADAEALFAELREACAPSAPPAAPECRVVVPLRPGRPCGT
jgi:hypothetical protein